MPEIYSVSSLEKVLLHKKPRVEKRGKMAKNETFSFQIAYKYNRFANDIEVKIESEISDYITYRQVEYVPCTSVNLWEGDGFCFSNESFVCPDVLRPTREGKLKSRACAYSSAWFTVKGDLPVGKHKIKITLQAQWCDPLVAEYELEVLDFVLKDKEFVYTNWFHYDGIANYYNLPVFSKKYNEIMYDFIEKAIAHGVNMLLIPMFTPPLDTRVGGERKTVQLIDVYYNDGKYSFDFDRLISFMKKVQSMGIEYFEMSHLFTQWGAKCAPKIVATVDGKKKKIFGWKNGAISTEYTEFLGELLPKLRQRLIDEGFYSKCRFHLSDEPTEKCIEDYKKAHNVFKKSMPDAFITDALSHYDFYKDGLVDVAVCSIKAIDVFLENKVENLFAYYCCAESGDYYPNRYMAYTSLRNRVIGIQFYLNNISGFLQWGYNFYNSVLSDEPIDPYMITDGGGGYQSGDAFIVYPGKNGAYDSIRHEVFYDALQDMKLFYTLEEKIGREAVEALLHKYGYEKGFRTYPHDEKSLLKVRQEAQKILCEKQ
ncbi:MAG: DUF4091 domain-containing protein [Clostridia bacterium]|nr:DUF4091 domain-containing protein [Clostridia bacterium]